MSSPLFGALRPKGDRGVLHPQTIHGVLPAFFIHQHRYNMLLNLGVFRSLHVTVDQIHIPFSITHTRFCSGSMECICQICKTHRPRARRKCILCERHVGAGCYPEHCLVMDGRVGNGQPIVCRDCWSSYGPAPVSVDFLEIWKIMMAQGF